MASSMVLKIDGDDHVVAYTTTAERVDVCSVTWHNVRWPEIPTMLKFQIENAVAEIISDAVKADDVNIKWLTVGE